MTPEPHHPATPDRVAELDLSDEDEQILLTIRAEAAAAAGDKPPPVGRPQS